MIKVSLTTDAYEGKLRPSLFRFETVDVEPIEFIQKIRNGYNYCGLFKNENGFILDEFSIKEKNKENFLGTQVLTIDVDDVDTSKFPTIESYLNAIGDIKPSFIYPSYSHNKEKENSNNVCIRFHLVYFFKETLTDIDYYNVVERLKKDLPTPTDKKAEHHIQFFYGCYNFTEAYIFGSSKDNIKVWSITDLNKGFTDFDNAQILNYYKTLPEITETPKNKFYYSNLKKYNMYVKNYLEKGYKDLDISMLMDMEYGITIKDLYRRYAHKYKSVYRVEEDSWVELAKGLPKIQVVNQEKFFMLNWLPKDVILKKRDRKGREKFTYNRMCIVRLLKHNISVNELIFNYYTFIKQHIDNNDHVFTIKKLLDNSIKIVRTPMNILSKHYGKVRQLLKTKQELQNKGGLISKHKDGTSAALKMWRKKILNDTYNPNKTDKANLLLFKYHIRKLNNIPEHIKNKLVEISLPTFKRYKKEEGIYSVSRNIHTDEELLGVIDFNLTGRENLRQLKFLGYKVGINRVQSLIRQQTKTAG